ncbi:helix-turn-helix domain-containing protein, partial [Streptomyces sp. AF1A]|uniref:helix-turn-helix domain-containing protein n=1 Tax=Streptomyces sp. AF1A TaxID=3394350 RepID=UPI0039BD59CF
GPSGAPRTSTGPTGASAARPASGSAGATGAAGARPDSASTPGVSAPRPTSGPASTPGVSAARPTSGSAGTQGVSATRPATGLSTAPGASATRPATGPGGTPGVSPVRPTSATDTFGDTHLAVYALGAGGDFVLGVASGEREPGGHTIASVAAVLLSLLTGEHQSGAGAARSSALVRLLLGAPPESVAALLGDGEWVVVHARPETQAPDAVAASALGAAVGSPLVDLGRDVVRVLVPAERELAAVPGWTLGVSAAVEPREWPAADLQAARALARALAMRSALVRHRGEPGIAELVPPHQARTHARALLAPLAGRPALAETLRTWLSLHGSWDRTAVALDVHRNTVRQRIARCSSLLDTDLDDPDVRMELWFALRHG